MNTSVDKSLKRRKSLGVKNATPAKAEKLNTSLQILKSKTENEAKEAPTNNVVVKNNESPKNISVDKSLKRRKSLGAKNATPAKAAKLNESLQIPKTKSENEVKEAPANNVVVKNNESPKKQAKPENGVSPLKKFKGTKSLDVSGVQKTENGGKKKKVKKVMENMKKRKEFLFDLLQKRVETEGKETVIKSIHEKMDAILSRTELTKTAKKNLKLHRALLKALFGEESNSIASPQSMKNKPKNVKAKKENIKPVKKVD